ncbi:hypothetical protein KKI23_02825 [Patescibacteria group bacterium]|nr:hypothetical protein [Patescibacteria group bacterium]
MAKTKRKANNLGLAKILIIIIVVVVLLAGALVAAYFIYSRPTNDNTNTVSNANANTNTNQPVNRNLNVNSNVNGNANVNLNTNTAVVDSTAKLKIALKNIAVNFTEVWGSFSNQSNFENIDDLKVFMTTDMQDWADDYVENARANRPTDAIYYGISSKAITTELAELNETKGTAEFIITCQRKESTGSVTNSQIFYQDNIIKMEKMNDVWLVAGSFWQ